MTGDVMTTARPRNTPLREQSVSGPGGDRDGGHRGLRLHGRLPGRPRFGAGRLLGLRGVLGSVRPGHRCRQRVASRDDPRGSLRRLCGGAAGRTHASAAGGGHGGPRRRGRDRRQLTAVERPGVRAGALAFGGSAQRRAGRVLSARDPARHAGRHQSLDAVRVADGHRRPHPGGRRDGHRADRLGPGRIPVGHRRGCAGLADDDRRVSDDAGGGRSADAGRYRDLSYGEQRIRSPLPEPARFW
jgi:hypothetical protein